MALTKAVIVNLDAPGSPPVPVMFNPPQYELSKGNQFAEIRVPGLPSTVLQFVHGQSSSLSMELFFDTTANGLDVRTRTAALTQLTEPLASTHAPPRLLLLWGSLAFQGVLISVRQSFDYFDANGFPLRARLQVEFKGKEPLERLAASLPLAQIEQASAYVIKAGETLQSIAATVLNDPGRWRELAQANEVDDPRGLLPGMRLQIPQGGAR